MHFNGLGPSRYSFSFSSVQNHPGIWSEMIESMMLCMPCRNSTTRAKSRIVRLWPRSCIHSRLRTKLSLELRTLTHSTIVSCSADLPLVAAADQHVVTKPTPMELDTANFVTQQAHNASLVMSVRELSSGAAKDISGTLRITRGGEAAYGNENEVDIPAKELLYLVQRDGTVKVFGRGEGNT